MATVGSGKAVPPTPPPPPPPPRPGALNPSTGLLYDPATWYRVFYWVLVVSVEAAARRHGHLPTGAAPSASLRHLMALRSTLMRLFSAGSASGFYWSLPNFLPNIVTSLDSALSLLVGVVFSFLSSFCFYRVFWFRYGPWLHLRVDPMQCQLIE